MTDGQIPLNQRRSDKRGPEYFPTPPWATRALCEFLGQFTDTKKHSVWEPACGEGFMSLPLSEYFASVYSTDLHDRSHGWAGQSGVCDFLLDWPGEGPQGSFDWIITNPPFVLGSEFLELSLMRARLGVAMLVKQQFLEGINRFRDFYNWRPPVWVLQFAERVPIVQGGVDPTAATNQSYIWVIWVTDIPSRRKFQNRDPATRLHWIGPCRKRLEKVSDYRLTTAKRLPPPAPLFDTLGGLE